MGFARRWWVGFVLLLLSASLVVFVVVWCVWIDVDGGDVPEWRWGVAGVASAAVPVFFLAGIFLARQPDTRPRHHLVWVAGVLLSVGFFVGVDLVTGRTERLISEGYR